MINVTRATSNHLVVDLNLIIFAVIKMKTRSPLIFTLFFSLICLNGFGQLANGLVGEYLFNGDLTDSSPSNITGMGNNLQLVTGHDGTPNSAYHFDGNLSYIDLGTSMRGILDEFTVSMYVRSVDSGGAMPLGDKAINQLRPGFKIGISSQYNTNPTGHVFLGIYRSLSNGTMIAGDQPPTVVDGLWHCVVVVKEKWKARIYVDGILADSTHFLFNPSLVSPEPWYIGLVDTVVNSGHYFYKGDLDNYRIWNRPLTQVEVDSLCACPSTAILGSNQREQCRAEGSVVIKSSLMNGSSYQWSPTGATSDSIVVPYPDSGWFVLNVVTTDGCSVVDSTFVRWIEPPSLALPSSFVGCASSGTPITINAGIQADSYQWSTGGTSATENVSYPDSGWVTLEATSDGCTSRDSTFIRWTSNPPTPDLGADRLVCSGDYVYLRVDNTSGTITWSNGSSGSSLLVNSFGTYWVSVSNDCGMGTDTIHIAEDSTCIFQNEEDLAPFFIPSSFSPNADRINDAFHIVPNKAFDQFAFQIFDRWGNLIFESSDPNFKWYGDMPSGEPAIQGAYAFVVHYKVSGSAETEIQRGWLTLLR